MKTLLLFLTVSLCSIELQAQDDCKLIENLDPSSNNVSYQTVFTTIVAGKDKFNIKFWKFTDKFIISCFVVTKDTFCVDPASTVTFNFTDGSSFNFVSNKKQNCRGELDKDYKNDEIPDENFPLAQKKVRSIIAKGIASSKNFQVDESTAASIQHAFICIVKKHGG